MKILRVYFRLPPIPGGMEIHIAEISRRQAVNHEVTLAFSLGADVEGVESIRLLSDKSWFKRKVRPWTAFVFYFLLLKNLWRNKRKFDLVHIHGDWSSFHFAPLLKRITGAKRVFFSFHGYVQTHLMHTQLLPRTLSKCNTLFCTGFDAFEKLRPYCQAVFLPSGVRNEFYNSSWNDPMTLTPHIVTTSIFRKEKNLAFFLQIAGQLPEAKFTLIGDGPDYQYITDIIEQMNLSNISLVGFCAPKALIEKYNQSTLYLHVSFEEGTPTTVMEAMVLGMPVISAHSPGLEKICIPEENGILIEDGPKTLQHFVAAIKQLSNDLDKRKKFSNNNKENASQLSWPAVLSRMEESICVD